LRLGERTWMTSLLNARVELWILRRNQNRLAEAKEGIELCLEDFPERHVFCRCVLAHLSAELGELDEAGRLFEELAADGFAAVPRTSDRLVNLGLLSDVAGLLGAAEHAEPLYEALLPAAACNAVDVPEIFTGALARNLGVLAALLGRRPDAERHFAAALELNERFGATAWVNQTERDRARMLQLRRLA
jgi:tetratricopeptide (TPR) repeat protein